MNALFWFSYALLWGLLAIVSVSVFALYHHFGQMYLTSREGRENQGPAEGTALRRVEATDIDGVPVLLPPRGVPALLVFTSTTCPVCEAVRADLIRTTRDEPGVKVYVFCHGSTPAVREWAGELADVATVLADQRLRLTARYEVGVTPFGIAVGADGAVKARGIVNDGDGLRALAGMARDVEGAR